ncbi:DNA binding protein [Fragilaria crotonensis]|nr:DNA binding protein [Fragilaria crotonensis]
MDQTPVFFSMVPRITLDHVGARTVNVCTSTNSTMRVTDAVTVTACGKTLPPLIVFKGKGGGRIEREFISFNQGAAYAVKPAKAWMDEDVMKFSGWKMSIFLM